MAFWGVVIEPGKPYTLRMSSDDSGPPKRLRISQAVIGSINNPMGLLPGRSVCSCHVGSNREVHICSLLMQGDQSSQLHLEYQESDDVVFSVIGPRDIHLSGYYLHSTTTNENNKDMENAYRTSSSSGRDKHIEQRENEVEEVEAVNQSSQIEEASGRELINKDEKDRNDKSDAVAQDGVLMEGMDSINDIWNEHELTIPDSEDSPMQETEVGPGDAENLLIEKKKRATESESWASDEPRDVSAPSAELNVIEDNVTKTQNQAINDGSFNTVSMDQHHRHTVMNDVRADHMDNLLKTNQLIFSFDGGDAMTRSHSKSKKKKKKKKKLVIPVSDRDMDNGPNTLKEKKNEVVNNEMTFRRTNSEEKSCRKSNDIDGNEDDNQNDLYSNGMVEAIVQDENVKGIGDRSCNAATNPIGGSNERNQRQKDGNGYKPSPEFEEDMREPLIELSLTDSTELWLIQWPISLSPDFDGQEVSLKLHQDGHLGSFEDSSGKQYDMISQPQRTDFTVFQSAASETKIVGKISRHVSLVHYPEPNELENLFSNNQGSAGTSFTNSSRGSEQRNPRSGSGPATSTRNNGQKCPSSEVGEQSTEDSGQGYCAVTSSGSLEHSLQVKSTMTINEGQITDFSVPQGKRKQKLKRMKGEKIQKVSTENDKNYNKMDLDPQVDALDSNSRNPPTDVGNARTEGNYSKLKKKTKKKIVIEDEGTIRRTETNMKSESTRSDQHPDVSVSSTVFEARYNENLKKKKKKKVKGLKESKITVDDVEESQNQFIEESHCGISEKDNNARQETDFSVHEEKGKMKKIEVVTGKIQQKSTEIESGRTIVLALPAKFESKSKQQNFKESSDGLEIP